MRLDLANLYTDRSTLTDTLDIKISVKEIIDLTK